MAADEQELQALLDEVRALRDDLEILKANPVIGDAVAATLSTPALSRTTAEADTPCSSASPCPWRRSRVSRATTSPSHRRSTPVNPSRTERGHCYIPFAPVARSVEAGWLTEGLAVPVSVQQGAPMLNLRAHGELPALDELLATARAIAAESVVVEGVGGFLWAALLRSVGFAGALTVIPYVNPTSSYDVSCILAYRPFALAGDRVLVGSSPSARILRSLGVDARVCEVFGVDCDLFRPGAYSAALLDELGIQRGRMLLFAGRGQQDKDIYRLLRVAFRAQLLFEDMQVVLCLRAVDDAYVAPIEKLQGRRVRVLRDPPRRTLAQLYASADVFVTAATSPFETFGRAPAEALACGTPVVAPRFDGFPEVLAQPGTALVELDGVDADENQLLRAVYEMLSRPPAREETARAARDRFARSQTVAIAFAADPPPRPEGFLKLELPAAWPRQLSLGDLWRPGHARFATFDDDLRASVRACLACH